ncbi:hypothetical protein SISNIDRAFT_488631 [Sistotremastrum niveocremeum HHB9708]|uniref:Transcription factor domain-containing protein n=1 Tax=Sistotremastrum niveocremeum HHB9708 TaxID=1314777 RepID=A0A164QZ47_9AGAM|nr:hypothetical protein SISNIDRAFT_488631 [Sistotremastrum niveocremeum HHB9708]
MNGTQPLPPVLEYMPDFHHLALAPIPPNLSPRPLKIFKEPPFKPKSPPNPLKMGSWEVQRDHYDLAHSPPLIDPAPRAAAASINGNQEWLNTASATKQQTNNDLHVGLLADTSTQESSSRGRRDSARSPSPRIGEARVVETASQSRQAQVSNPHRPSVPLDSDMAKHLHSKEKEKASSSRCLSICNRLLTHNQGEPRISRPPKIPASSVKRKKALRASDSASRATNTIILKLGHRDITVSEDYLENCRDRAFEVFPHKFAGFGGVIDRKTVDHVRRLADPKLSPSKAALLLLIIHCGHVNAKHPFANPLGLSIESEEFAQLLIDEARDRLRAADLGRTREPTTVIQATLLLGYNCLYDNVKWSAFLPMLRGALVVDQMMRLRRQKHGEKFGVGARKHEMRRRASFGLMVLDAYRSPADYNLTDTQLDALMPLDVQYDEIVDGAIVPKTDETTFSDISLLMINGRLLISKIRLLNVLGPISNDDIPSGRNRVSETLRIAVRSYVGESNGVLASRKNHRFPLLELALKKISDVKCNSVLDLAILIEIVREVPLVDIEERRRL